MYMNANFKGVLWNTMRKLSDRINSIGTSEWRKFNWLVSESCQILVWVVSWKWIRAITSATQPRGFYLVSSSMFVFIFDLIVILYLNTFQGDQAMQRRQLASLDLFLESARHQLSILMDNNSSSDKQINKETSKDKSWLVGVLNI